MKKILAIVFALILGISQNGLLVANASSYDYELIDKATNPTIKQGETKMIWVKLKNTGTETWKPDWWPMPLETKDSVGCINNTESSDIKGGCILPPPQSGNAFRLGTIRPTDRNSGFKAEYDWISTNRINANFWEEIKPGQIVTIGFNISAPYDMNTGIYREYFAPVVENVTWLPDHDLFWDITVINSSNPAYAAEMLDGGTRYLTLKPNESSEISYQIKNVGSEIWYKNGANPVHVATYYQKDRSSDLYASENWISPNRPNGLQDEIVRPGEITTLKYIVKVPASTTHSTINESFWLVAENKSWFEPADYPATMDIQITIPNINSNQIDLEKSTIVASKNQVLADGVDFADLKINLLTQSGESATNKSFWLATFGCARVGVGCWKADDILLTTDNTGQASYRVTNTSESEQTYSVNVDNQYLISSADVTFYKKGHESIDFQNTKTDKTQIYSSKNDYATVESYLKYNNGDVVSNKDVQLYIEVNGQSVIMPYEKSMPENIWLYSDQNGKISYQINGAKYKSGDKLKVYFATNSLDDKDFYLQSVKSQELEIVVL